MAQEQKQHHASHGRWLSWAGALPRTHRAKMRLLLSAALMLASGGALAEAPKRGGILTYMISWPMAGPVSMDIAKPPSRSCTQRRRCTAC